MLSHNLGPYQRHHMTATQQNCQDLHVWEAFRKTIIFDNHIDYTSVTGHRFPNALVACSYDLALISGALSEIRDHFNLSEALEEAIVGAAKIGAFFGTFLGNTSHFTVALSYPCCHEHFGAHVVLARCKVRMCISVWTPSLHEFLSAASNARHHCQLRLLQVVRSCYIMGAEWP